MDTLCHRYTTTSDNKYPKLYLKCFIRYRLVRTFGFHPEALPTSEPPPGPPQHTQEELGDPHHICMSLEVQDQTVV